MSIKIILENINSHVYSEFGIRAGEISLIKGYSGAGKSSIFQGISWGLHGKLKGLCNHNSTKYSVTLVFQEFTICRKGKPKLLQIIFPNQSILEDEVAQKYIDQFFGNESIFNATCYLEQDSRSTLLNGSNADRMEILNNLSFWTDNPDIYLSKIDQEIKTQQQNFLIEQTKYSTEVKVFSDQLTLRPVDMNHNYTENQLIEISTKIRDLDDRVLTTQEEINRQNKILGSLEAYKTKLSQHNNFLSNVQSESELLIMVENIDKELESLQSKLQNVNNLINMNTSDLTNNRNLILNRITQLESSLKQRQSMESMLNNNSNQLKQLKFQYDNLNQRLTTNQVNKLNGEYTPTDQYNILQQENLRKSHIELCKNLGINYATPDIEDFKIYLQKCINDIQSYKDDLKIHNNIEIIKNQITRLNLEGCVDIDESEVSKIRDEYNNMILSSGLLICPHCTRPVKYSQGILHAESREIYTPEQVSAIKTRLEKIKRDKETLVNANVLKNQILELSKLLKGAHLNETQTLNNLNVNNLENYKQALNVLINIKVIPESEVSSEKIRLHLEYLNVQNEYNKFDVNQIKFYENMVQEGIRNLEVIPKDLEMVCKSLKSELNQLDERISKVGNEYRSEVNSIKSSISTLQSQRSIYNSKIAERNIKLQEIKSLEKQIIELEVMVYPELDKKLLDYKDQVQQYKIAYEKGTYLRDMTQRQSQLNVKFTKINQDNTLLASLYNLKQSAFDIECTQLQITVDSINESLNDILQDIFEKPIKVLLQLYKKNKTNDKVKANVNLYVQYDGNEYDSINKLSGGEKDRISFALTLALNRINGSPFLLLDETLRSLNDSYRTLCIETMREFLGGLKTILCINHEDIEGNYDSVICL